MMNYASVIVSALAAALALSTSPANAMTGKECHAKFAAAKTAGTLAGKTYAAFKVSDCGIADAAKPAQTTAAAAPQGAKPVASVAPNAVFPASVAAAYAKESGGKARMHTCRDQYNSNKTANANGGLKWIMKGGGYYSECVKRLKDVKA